jgi:hypothetical protein
VYGCRLLCVAVGQLHHAPVQQQRFAGIKQAAGRQQGVSHLPEHLTGYCGCGLHQHISASLQEQGHRQVATEVSKWVCKLLHAVERQRQKRQQHCDNL